jgi:hypothetical protein
MKTLRLSPMQRVTGALWGLIVTGVAVTAMYALSGADVNLTNVIIVGLFVLGGWLVISALAAVRPRKRRPDAVVADGPDLAEEPTAVASLAEAEEAT